MIQTCKRCGGLYATEEGETFAGTPCKCPSPAMETFLAGLCSTSSDWLGGLRQRVCPQCGGRGTVQDDRELGDALQKKREEAKVTLREVGRRLGFSAAYISDLEHGRRSWNAKKIADYLNALRPPSDKISDETPRQ